MGFNGIYPLVICYIAIENGQFMVDLPIKDGDFPVRYVSLPEANLFQSIQFGESSADHGHTLV